MMYVLLSTKAEDTTRTIAPPARATTRAWPRIVPEAAESDATAGPIEEDGGFA
jgi:hypothetical protein